MSIIPLMEMLLFACDFSVSCHIIYLILNKPIEFSEFQTNFGCCFQALKVAIDDYGEWWPGLPVASLTIC